MLLRRRLALLAACAVGSLAAIADTAVHADPYLPPGGKLFAGVTGGKDVAAYEQATGQHPAVFQFFSSYGSPTEYMFEAAERERARLMMHVSTLTGGRETITPGAIATGAEDDYLIALNQRIAESPAPVYV